jgi:hypothetical protein
MIRFHSSSFSPFFDLVIFHNVSCFCPGLALEHDPPTYASHVAEITDMTHHAWLILLRWGFTNFFEGVSLELQSCQSLPPK